ncbi:MAG: hypothetical protein IKG58_03495 [Bacilli bacterium]|nr:hypothetical protein [Bacilli bacterium]MBR3049601.1 hypothetical protein [Bacilli bacterium]
MSDYKEYVNAVNKLFDCVNIMKKKWDSQDNLSHLANIEDYKQDVIDVSKKLKNGSNNKVEELGQ